VTEICCPGCVRLATDNGVPLPNPWNIEHLRKFFPLKQIRGSTLNTPGLLACSHVHPVTRKGPDHRVDFTSKNTTIITTTGLSSSLAGMATSESGSQNLQLGNGVVRGRMDAWSRTTKTNTRPTALLPVLLRESKDKKYQLADLMGALLRIPGLGRIQEGPQ
jgi:hypothetical protein